MKLDTSSLAHTQWECKYHIVFASKYRRQIIYGKIKQDIGQMIRKRYNEMFSADSIYRNKGERLRWETSEGYA